MKKYLTQFKELLIVALFSVLLTIIFTYPAISNLTDKFIGDGGDNYQYAAYQALASKNMLLGNFPFGFSDFWRYPVGFDFARSFDFYLSVLTGALIYPFFGIPLSYNLTILFFMFANGLTSFFLFKFLTNSKILGLLGMVIYGFSFYNISKASSHPNLLLTAGFPLFFLAVVKIAKENLEKKHIILLFLSIIIIALGSAQYLLFLFLFSFIYFSVAYFFYKDILRSVFSKLKTSGGFFFLSLFLSFSFLLFSYYPHLKAFITNNISVSNREDILFKSTPSFSDFFLPNSYLKLWTTKLVQSTSDASIEKAVFFGWIEIILFSWFFFSKNLRKDKIFIGILFLIPFALSLGFGKDNNFFLLPYKYISSIFPFNLISETGRFSVIYLLFSTTAIVLALKSFPKGRIKNTLIGIIFLLIILERLPTQFYLAQTFRNEPFIEPVRKSQTAVLDIPISIFDPRYDIFSIYYNKPIVNGYFHWSADGEKEKSFIQESGLERYSCSNEDPILKTGMDFFAEEALDKIMLNKLRESKISTIVVHKDDKFYHPICKNLRIRLGKLLPFIKSVEPTSVDKEKKINAKADGFASFTLYFPYSGTFYMDGLYIAPTSKSVFEIRKNKLAADFPYFWSIRDNFSMELYPKFTISTKVEKGTTITFFSNDLVETTWFSIWYRYVADQTQIKPFKTDIIKIFEDEKAVVYSLE